MKTKTLLAVEWTDVAIENVPIVSATGLEVLAAKRFLHFVERSNHNRATRLMANAPQRMAQVFAEI
jgi:hypothetical protein